MDFPVALRVSLFIDYQNAYHGARDLFHCLGDDHTCGQFFPWDLGKLICSKHNDLFQDGPFLELGEVRVYRGEPNRSRDELGHRAFQRQRTAWENAGVKVFSSLLQYSGSGEVEGEKEIDVMLALDFVTGAIHRTYDVGVLFSNDRDLMPALKYVRQHESEHCRADVAGWGGRDDGRYLQPPGARPIRHLVGRTDFSGIADNTNYARKASSFRRERRRKRRR